MGDQILKQGIKPSTGNQQKGYVIALVGTVIWSSTAIIIRFLDLNYSITPLLLALIRDGLAGLIVVVSVIFIAPHAFLTLRRRFLFLMLYGLVLAIFNTSWTVSVSLNGAAVSTVLAYSSPVFTVLISKWLFKEKLGWLKGLLVVICLVGCVLVAGAVDPRQWAENPTGIVLGLISGLAFAGYSLMGKAAAARGMNTWAALGVTFIFAAGFLLILNLLLPNSWGISSPGLLWQDQDLKGWLLLLLLAAVPTIGGYGLYNLSLRFLPTGISNLIATSEPVFTALQAALILQERYSSNQIWGSLIILASIVVLRISYKE